MSGQQNRLLGRWGEGLAAQYLRTKGYQVVGAGWRCRFGEIDLIAENKTYLCFVEVKLRKNDKNGRAAEFVDQRKQQRLRITAQQYLADYQGNLQPRFDVIEIYAPQGMNTAHPELTHLENAF